MNRSRLRDRLERVVLEAGDEIMKVRERGDLGLRSKDDARGSPVSRADHRAHDVLVKYLRKLTPEVPVISEESPENRDVTFRRGLDRFWLVDPLDGTREFVAGRGEFTVNVGLIEQGRPTEGFILVPAAGDLYRTDGDGAVVRRNDRTERLRVSTRGDVQSSRVVYSRSHDRERALAFLRNQRIERSWPCGSSLKLCRVAEGTADVYLRFGDTFEWDTAAGHALLEAAGGKCTRGDGGALLYNKPDLTNDGGLLATNGALHGIWHKKLIEYGAE